jgi:hypothetical protein
MFPHAKEVFLSHSGLDREFAIKIVELLRVTVFRYGTVQAASEAANNGMMRSAMRWNDATGLLFCFRLTR